MVYEDRSVARADNDNMGDELGLPAFVRKETGEDGPDTWGAVELSDWEDAMPVAQVVWCPVRPSRLFRLESLHLRAENFQVYSGMVVSGSSGFSTNEDRAREQSPTLRTARAAPSEVLYCAPADDRFPRPSG